MTTQETNHTNWAGNIRYSTDELHTPTDTRELQALVQRSRHIKALGSRHSFNGIADSSACQVSLAAFNQVLALDEAAQTVTVGGGMRYGELAPYLHERGFALHNLASLPHISVVGACATATHGSGLRNGNLATAVSAFTFVAADGELVSLSREKDGELFRGAVVHLGALGIVTSITLDVQPAFPVRQVVYQNLPMAELERNFTAVMEAGYSVSLFTTWQNKTINQIWVKSLATDTAAPAAPAFYGATQASGHLHPLEELSPEHATEQLGLPGAWHERLPHFKMGFQPSAGEELQSEYFVPLEAAYPAMMALEKLHGQISPYLYVSEIRAIAADELWMSPNYKRASVAFHFTWKQEWEAVRKLLPLIEQALAPYEPRPHWGKLFTMPPATVQAGFSRLSDFKVLVRQYDPQGKFRNAFLAQNLYGA